MNPQTTFVFKISALVLTIGMIILIPVYFFKSSAAVVSEPTPPPRPENYDIRSDIEKPARNLVSAFAAEASKDALNLKTDRDSSLRAGQAFLRLNKNALIERNITQFPEIIDSGTSRGGSFLVSASSATRAETLRRFIADNTELFGIASGETDRLRVTADYRNPDGKLSFASLEQRIGTTPVFQGEIKAGFSKRGEMFRIINNLAPNLDSESLTKDFGSPEKAVADAARLIGVEVSTDQLTKIESPSDPHIAFNGGPFRDLTTAEKVYFPIDSGVARTAWKVLLQTFAGDFYVVVDAASGALLWRKNLTEHQTQPATYSVYGNNTSMSKTADGPAAYTPGCPSPLACPEQPLAPRQSFTLIGNEPPNQFNNLGWINDNENRTIGNNIEAGIDRDGINGVDPNGYAVGNPPRNFVFNYNPAPGNPPPGDNPLDPVFQMGSVTHAFYMANRWHDETYRLGFTEQARNFQTDNFGRGGLGSDSISVEIQDSSGTSGANFSTPADGGRPRLQLFIWAFPTPDRDGGLDSQVGFHELTHGLSNRLHGNSGGLSANMARGMGEGWSDFYALAMLSEPTDDPLGIHAVGSYSTFDIVPNHPSYYYGIRRFPVAVKAAIGPNGLPHSPLTFRYLNSDCNLLIGTSSSNPNSAFPRGPIGVQTCDQVHNIGEVWSVALWEVRNELIVRHGAAEGNRRALQYVTDGMKLAPLNPTILQERDAIIAAATVSDSGDILPVRRGFAIRGMGYYASIQNAGTGNNNTVVTESFQVLGNVRIGNAFAVSDAPGNNNGFPEPGENVRISLPLLNDTTTAITGVTARLANGPSAFYGDVAAGQTLTQELNYQIPANAPCGSVFSLVFTMNGSAGEITETRTIRLGVPIGGGPTVFVNSTPVTINDAAASSPYGTTIDVTGLSGQKKIKLELTGITHSFVGDLDFLLVGPGNQKFIVMSDAINVIAPRTGANVVLSDDAAQLLPNGVGTLGGDWKPTNYLTGDTFVSPAPDAPYLSPGTAGTDTFLSAFGGNGIALNGTWTLYVVDDAMTWAGSMTGWKLTFESTDYSCAPVTARKARSDFDGDGKSDVAVFRPSEGNWYANGSSTGFMALHWGANGDRPTPGDFDGDNKTDFAVFRPNADPAQPDFYIFRSSDLGYSGVSWGLPGDIPVVADYDGDSRDDIAVFRPSNHTFYVLRSAAQTVLSYSGINSGNPIPGDFDGDGKADFATFSTDRWYLAPSNINYSGVSTVIWGTAGDLPVAGDYDGDGRDDFAVYRPSTTTWWIRGSAGTNFVSGFGLPTDTPTPGDFDGDGKMDIAVYREGTWYINRSNSGLMYAQFGLPGDLPIPKAYIP